jgi:peptide chain release factor subunit 1
VEPTILDQDLITRLISRPRVEEPVLSLYMKATGSDRKATLKNLLRDGEKGIEADTGWDAEHKKAAHGILDALRAKAEALMASAPTKGRGSIALFADAVGVEALSLPLDVRDRIVVDRSPYSSPLSSLIDQYERYGVVICDQKHARLFDVYLGEATSWEEIKADRTAHDVTAKAKFQGLEELRREHHGNYVLHQHLKAVADRLFRRYKLRPFDRVILCGHKEILQPLEDHLHSYLRGKVAAREVVATNLSKAAAVERVLEVEARIEQEKEIELLSEIRSREGANGLAVIGMDPTLRALFYGKVKTLVVSDEEAVAGRECPDCHFLFEHPEDIGETAPTLVECVLCKRPTRRVPDIVDEAVEMAILSGSHVEHIVYSKEELTGMGGMAAVLRFK